MIGALADYCSQDNETHSPSHNMAQVSAYEQQGDVKRRRSRSDGPVVTLHGGEEIASLEDEKKPRRPAKVTQTFLYDADAKSLKWHLTYWIMPIIFTALALFTRLWKIEQSKIVVWDEAQYDTRSIPLIIVSASLLPIT